MAQPERKRTSRSVSSLTSLSVATRVSCRFCRRPLVKKTMIGIFHSPQNEPLPSLAPQDKVHCNRIQQPGPAAGQNTPAGTVTPLRSNSRESLAAVPFYNSPSGIYFEKLMIQSAVSRRWCRGRRTLSGQFLRLQACKAPTFFCRWRGGESTVVCNQHREGVE